MLANTSNDPSRILDTAALRSVDRVLAALRRGEPVAVVGSGGSVCLALSVEMAEDAALAELTRLAGGGLPALAVTRRRAVILGLVGEGEGAVVLTLKGGIDAEAARALADPERGADPPDTSGAAGGAAGGAGPRLQGDLTVEIREPGGVEAAAVDLAKLARLLPAVILVPVRGLRGQGSAWAARHDVLAVRAGDVADYRVHVVRTLARVAEAPVPLEGAEDTRVIAFRPADGGPEYLAIVIGEPAPDQPVLARLHSECFTGDLLGSLRCDCGDQLRGAIREIAQRGSGVLLYLAQEGRGIGLVNKLRAYRLQDRGFDTVDANELLGFEADERVYLPAAAMLRQLGFASVRLMTNNPDKMRQLARWGIEVVERVPHIFPANGHNEGYLRTKAERSGHLF